MNPTEDEIAELENKIKERSNQIHKLRNQEKALNEQINNLNIINQADKVKLKKLKREAEIDVA